MALVEDRSSWTGYPDIKGKPIPDIRQCVAKALDWADSGFHEFVIPAPVLAEFLVKIAPEDQQKHLQEFAVSAKYSIADFGELEAIEFARFPSKHELRNGSDSSWQKIKFDSQIIAIALTTRASQIWSHDQDVIKRAIQMGIEVKTLGEV